MSEEISEGNTNNQQDDNSLPMNDFLQKVDVVSPLNYLQSICPPLTHFENLAYESIGGSNVGKNLESFSICEDYG